MPSRYQYETISSPPICNLYGWCLPPLVDPFLSYRGVWRLVSSPSLLRFVEPNLYTSGSMTLLINFPDENIIIKLKFHFESTFLIFYLFSRKNNFDIKLLDYWVTCLYYNILHSYKLYALIEYFILFYTTILFNFYKTES